MSNDWYGVISVCYIFIFMAIAKLIKEKLGLFRSIIFPTSLLAGFFGLICGPEVLGLINYDFSLYEKLVFHFMGIGFIALTLSERKNKQKEDSLNSGLFIISTYCFQGVIGMLLVFLLTITFKPDLFVGLGLILPLAYGQGPGFASSIGSSWDKILSFGFINQYGLTLATSGFLVAGTIGLILLNYYAHKYKISVKKLNKIRGLQYKDLTITSIDEINFFDMLSVQVVMIAIVYFGTYILMYLLSSLLENFGSIGQTVSGLIKGFNYLFGILLAILLKRFLSFLNNRGHRSKELLNSYLMQNISSLSFGIMITASVMAISIEIINDYWELLLTVAIGGAIFTLIFVIWLGKKVFKTNPLHYILAMFGMLTGTASTGLALLRGVDPDLNTDVATNLVLGSAIAAPLGIPLMVLLGFPVVGYTENHPVYYYITFFGLLLYCSLMILILLLKAKKSKKNKL